ncbi:hypothetical protein [Phytopseudomonas dryadis]|uniref:hypothetical protein n=1 Tax=Pseudomonadaceae TaxID=135621 RepID=UPI0010373C79|nr:MULTISPECIES: hypothetical protein [Pseudomonas]
MSHSNSIAVATEPMDMCTVTETTLAREFTVFGMAKQHCVYFLQIADSDAYLKDLLGVASKRGSTTAAPLMDACLG